MSRTSARSFIGGSFYERVTRVKLGVHLLAQAIPVPVPRPSEQWILRREYITQLWIKGISLD
jgi:hypothetical protein